MAKSTRETPEATRDTFSTFFRGELMPHMTPRPSNGTSTRAPKKHRLGCAHAANQVGQRLGDGGPYAVYHDIVGAAPVAPKDRPREQAAKVAMPTNLLSCFKFRVRALAKAW